MTSWPTTWRSRTLEAAGIRVTPHALEVLKAWQQSTPLPPFTNNPLGMPSTSRGALEYMRTGYAMFVTPEKFYAAFAAFAATSAGKSLAHAIADEGNYASVWRVISSLGWPAVRTETDWPSALLDLTEASYRESVATADPSARKTSGTVGAPAHVKATAISHASSVAAAIRTMTDAQSATQQMLRRHGRDGR